MNERLLAVNEILELLQPRYIQELELKRIGSDNDGGYVIVDDFKIDDFLISFGVGNDINFEAEMLQEISGAQLYDDSVSELPFQLDRAVFFQQRVGMGKDVSLKVAIERAPIQRDLLLKMDIEGTEWDVLDSSSDTDLMKFRQIVIELHWFAGVLENDFLLKTLRVLRKLNKTHVIINSHPNNWSDNLIIENLQLPNVIEVTYLRKDSTSRIQPRHAVASEQFLLNRPCNPHLPEIYLQRPIELEFLNQNSIELGLVSKNLQDELTLQRDELTLQRDELTLQRDELTLQRDELINSTIWKVTKPLRILINLLKRV